MIARLLAPATPLWAGTVLRAVFAVWLLGFFWRSALTKIDGFGLSAGAYAQILPRTAEAAGYDPAAMPAWATAIVGAGTLAEVVLPALLLAGLATRPAALGMIGFVAVMTAVDVTAHGVAPGALALPRAAMLALLAGLVWAGGGALSLDRWIAPRWPR